MQIDPPKGLAEQNFFTKNTRLSPNKRDTNQTGVIWFPILGGGKYIVGDQQYNGSVFFGRLCLEVVNFFCLRANYAKFCIINCHFFFAIDCKIPSLFEGR